MRRRNLFIEGNVFKMNDIYENGQSMIGEALTDMIGARLSPGIAEKDESSDYDAFSRAYSRFFSWYFVSRENPAPICG